MRVRLSHVRLFVTPWTVACQAPLSVDSPGKNPGEGCHALLQGGSSIPIDRTLISFVSCTGRWVLYHCVSVCVYVLNHFSCVQLFATLWTVALQAPLSMEFSRQEYWSGLPFPSSANLPDPGSNPGLPHCRKIFFFTIWATREAQGSTYSSLQALAHMIPSSQLFLTTITTIRINFFFRMFWNYLQSAPLKEFDLYSCNI